MTRAKTILPGGSRVEENAAPGRYKVMGAGEGAGGSTRWMRDPEPPGETFGAEQTMTKPIDPTVEGTIHRLADRRPGTVGRAGSNKASASGASPAPGLGLGVPRLTELERDMTETPEFDADRVAGLRQAVNSGRYQVNSGSIAAKLLAMEAELP